MADFVTIFLLGSGALWLLGFAAFALLSHFEGERRARRVALTVALGGGLFFVLAVNLPMPIRWVVFGIMILSGIVGLILFMIPIGKVEIGNDQPSRRVDERDIMFARFGLQPGSPEFEQYYQLRPENLASDNRFRKLPGLLQPGAKLANPFYFASADGSFGLTGALRDAVDGPVAAEQQVLPPAAITAFIKGLARYYGARDVGVAELQPDHVYSHIGRGSGVYGEPVALDHTHAIAFTVEMDLAMVGTGPHAPVTMESARQYVEAARVAVQLANTIRGLGYAARAHIDGNYRVIAPLVARDAGLGEIGRMTLLMTPNLGPRLRLGVVTTDLALIPDGRVPDPAVIDFCQICKKCAQNCPSRAIPFGDRVEIEGALRWKLDAESCFRYWNAVGTDCGRCMAVCPYAHPDTPAHNLVRWGIARSGAFRRFALWLDDFFYGQKPEIREAPEWARIK